MSLGAGCRGWLGRKVHGGFQSVGMPSPSAGKVSAVEVGDRTYTEVLLGLGQSTAIIPSKRGKIETLGGYDLRGHGVSSKGVPWATLGSSNVHWGDLEANMDFCSLRCTLARLKEESEPCLVYLEMGKGNFGSESFAGHGKEVLYYEAYSKWEVPGLFAFGLGRAR